VTDTPDSAPGEAWRFPAGALIAATMCALAAGMAMLQWMMFAGMGHGARTPRLDLIWYAGVALLFGAAWQYWDGGNDIAQAPPASRTTRLRTVGVLAYLLAVACLAIGVWALAMIAFF